MLSICHKVRENKEINRLVQVSRLMPCLPFEVCSFLFLSKVENFYSLSHKSGYLRERGVFYLCSHPNKNFSEFRLHKFILAG